MEPPVADIAFLSNSENRISVLRALGDGPHSRHVLMERTAVSRVTLGRILDELEHRCWITRSGQMAEITALGAWVVEAFGELCETLDAERRLREVIRWFPEPGYGFHVKHLADAEISCVRPADASVPITRLVKQFEAGGVVRAFSFAITSQFLEACWRHVTAGSVSFEWVFTPAVLAVLEESPEMGRQSAAMLASGDAEYRLYDGEIPYVVILAGRTVNLRLADAAGTATALIQSEDDAVRTWAESTFDEYRREANSVEAAAFSD